MVFNELKEEGEELFIEFSKKCPSFDEFNCRNFYSKCLSTDRSPEEKKITIASGLYWAREDNEALYETFFPSYYISIDDLMDIYNTSVIISKTLKSSLDLCNEDWYMLEGPTPLWRKHKKTSFYVIREIRKYIDYSNKKIVNKIALMEGEEKEKLIELSKKYLASYNRINQPSYFTVIIKLLRPQLSNESFASNLDNNAEKLAFKNGIYDIKLNTFREFIRAHDFITETIPFNYEPENESKKAFLRQY